MKEIEFDPKTNECDPITIGFGFECEFECDSITNEFGFDPKNIEFECEFECGFEFEFEFECEV